MSDKKEEKDSKAPAAGSALLKLIWYQRDDGLWNAECACGSTLCGWEPSMLLLAEEGHAEIAPEEGVSCGPHAPCPCCISEASKASARQRPQAVKSEQP